MNRDTRPFWDGCAGGELRVQRCTACRATQFPPRGRCGQCGASELEWAATDLRGEVYSFTVVHRAPSQAFRADCPYVVALVDVAPGARLMLNVTGCNPESVYIGMRVGIEFEQRFDADESVTVPIARAL